MFFSLIYELIRIENKLEILKNTFINKKSYNNNQNAIINLYNNFHISSSHIESIKNFFKNPYLSKENIRRELEPEDNSHPGGGGYPTANVLSQINSVLSLQKNKNIEDKMEKASIIQSYFKTENKNWTEESLKAKFGNIKLDKLTFNFLVNIYDNSNNPNKEEIMNDFFYFISKMPKEVLDDTKNLFANLSVIDERKKIDFEKTIIKFVDRYWIYQKIDFEEKEEDISIYKLQFIGKGEAIANELMDSFDDNSDPSIYIKEVVEILTTLNIRNKLGYLWFLVSFIEVIKQRGKDHIEKIKSINPYIYNVITTFWNDDPEFVKSFLTNITDLKKAIAPLKQPLMKKNDEYIDITKNIIFCKKNFFSNIFENNTKTFLLINRKDSKFNKTFFNFIEEILDITKSLENIKHSLKKKIIDVEEETIKDLIDIFFKILFDINKIGIIYKMPFVRSDIVNREMNK
jgi:hypothetical protein